jgi:SPP1 gp7 family putative phage head morphogenesis protein
LIHADHNVQLRLANTIAQHLAAANILGRRHVLHEVHQKTNRILPLATTSRKIYTFADDTLRGGFSTNVPPTGAVDYLRGLTPVTRDTFDGLTAQYRKDAFTIAGTSDVRLIAAIRDEMAKVTADGGTKQDFEKAANKLTSDAGVEQLNIFTLDTAFDTAIHNAYSLGRYEQMTDDAVKEVLPYWQYMTVGDLRVRPEHACLDYFVARADDPVWMKIYPPNGYNCRCIVICLLLSEAMLIPGYDEPGYARLPLLAMEKVPQTGFGKPFRVA